MTIDRTRAAQLASEVERLHKAMPSGPYEAEHYDIHSHHEDGQVIECETHGQAAGFVGLHRLAPEIAATIRGLVEECERMEAIVDDELSIEELARICDDPKTPNEQFERANDARFFTTQRRLAAVDAYRRSKP